MDETMAKLDFALSEHLSLTQSTPLFSKTNHPKTAEAAQIRLYFLHKQLAGIQRDVGKKSEQALAARIAQVNTEITFLENGLDLLGFPHLPNPEVLFSHTEEPTMLCSAAEHLLKELKYSGIPPNFKDTIDGLRHSLGSLHVKSKRETLLECLRRINALYDELIDMQCTLTPYEAFIHEKIELLLKLELA